MTVTVAPKALRDLEEIEDFTARRWGEQQATSYLERLWAVIEIAGAEPLRGRAIQGVPKLSSLRSGSHIIVYRHDPAADQIEIVRVLHQAMDFARHLRER